MKIRNTLLIGLAVIHLSVTNLIIASSSTTTSSSSKPVEQFNQDHFTQLMLARSAAEIPSTIAPHIPSLDAQVSSGFDASDQKKCNCANNSPSCIQCHLEEKEDLDELLKQAAANLPEPQSPVFVQPAVQIPSYNSQKPLPTPDQAPEQQSAAGTLLGKHARDISDYATTPSDSTKFTPRYAKKRIKNLNNNFLCLQCKEIFINDASVRRHLRASHDRTAYINKDYAYLPKQQSYTPEVINAAIDAAAKNAAKPTKKDSRQRQEALGLYQLQCLHCGSIKKKTTTMQSHLQEDHDTKSFKKAIDYKRIPGTSSQTIINGEKS